MHPEIAPATQLLVPDHIMLPEDILCASAVHAWATSQSKLSNRPGSVEWILKHFPVVKRGYESIWIYRSSLRLGIDRAPPAAVGCASLHLLLINYYYHYWSIIINQSFIIIIDLKRILLSGTPRKTQGKFEPKWGGRRRSEGNFEDQNALLRASLRPGFLAEPAEIRG